MGYQPRLGKGFKPVLGNSVSFGEPVEHKLLILSAIILLTTSKVKHNNFMELP